MSERLAFADSLLDAALEVATEHIAWCIRHGQTLQEIFDCLQVRMPANATWHEAIFAVAREYDLSFEIRARKARWRRAGPPVGAPSHRRQAA